MQGHWSDMLLSSTASPQSTVQSPFLFTVYTSNFQLQKFSDDNAILSITCDNTREHDDVVRNFVWWSECKVVNCLQLNTACKTKTNGCGLPQEQEGPTGPQHHTQGGGGYLLKMFLGGVYPYLNKQLD